MPKRAPGARAKGIGAELRRVRHDAQMTLLQVSGRLGWDKSRLSRIETGQKNQTVEEVSALLVVYGMNDDEDRERLFDAVRSVDEPGWWEKTSGVTKTSAALADYEGEAAGLVSWSPAVLPGRVQTMDYAGAVMEIFGLGADEIGLRLGARRERQRAVADKPYIAFVGESALRALIGGPQVMSAQLDTLLNCDVTVQVVPTATGAHLGQMGAFLLMRFTEAPVVVHVEMLSSGVFYDDAKLTSPYEDAVTQLAEVAMSEKESARLIEKIRKELEG